FRPSSSFPVWQGHVYAFSVCDEQLAATTGGSCSCLPAHTGYQICIQDKNGNPLTYDASGFLTAIPYWDAALCLAGNVAGTNYSRPRPPEPGTGPFDVSGCYWSAAHRPIKTAVLTGGATTYDGTTVIDFTDTNVTAGSALYTAVGATSVADGQKVVNYF